MKLNPINWLVKDSNEGMTEVEPQRKKKIIEALKQFLDKSLGMVHIRIALPTGAAGSNFEAGRIELYDHTIKCQDKILKFQEATVDINASLLSQCGLFDSKSVNDLQKRFFKKSGSFCFVLSHNGDGKTVEWHVVKNHSKTSDKISITSAMEKKQMKDEIDSVENTKEKKENQLKRELPKEVPQIEMKKMKTEIDTVEKKEKKPSRHKKGKK